MKTEFIENLFRLVVESEEAAWEYRNGQDSVAVCKAVTDKLAKKYSKHPVANITFKGDSNSAYARLDPADKAVIDLYIMKFMVVRP